MRAPTWPWVIPCAAAAAVLFGTVLTVNVPVQDATYLLLDAVVGLTYPLVGALIVARRPGNPIGWLFCLGGTGLALQALAGGYSVYGQAHGWPGTEFGLWVVNWVFFIGFGPLFLLPAILPDGRLPSRRWWPVMGALIAAMAILQVVLMFRDMLWLWGSERPSPVGFVPTEIIAACFGVVVSAAAVVGAVALGVRVRRAQDRRQLMPLFPAAVAIALAALVDATHSGGTWSAGIWLLALTLPALPLATAVSIFRYRLFDIEVLIRRTVVYVLVAALLLGAYLATVITLNALFRQQGGVLESLLATGVVAVAFAPARDAVQRAVSRVLFGNRGEPAAALSHLGQRLEATAAPTELLDGAAETVARTLRLPSVAVLTAAEIPVSVFGGVPDDGVRITLLSGGRTEGALLAAPRSPGEPLTRADRAVLDDLAPHLAVALAAVRLATEVRDSRERLVKTREEERRRLRRDLHDGLGADLTAIGLRLYVIEATAPPELREQVTGVRELTQAIVGDVRRIVHDLRPPALDELGLSGALEDLALDAQNGPNIAVTIPEPLPALPAAVEVAAYRITQEALSNALKHAGAANVEITAKAVPDRLVLRIRDDGRGLPEPLREGVGSGSMRERAAEVGGELRRSSEPGRGTLVEAILPLSTTIG